MSDSSERVVYEAFGRCICLEAPAAAQDLARERLPPDYRAVSGTPECTWKVDQQDRAGWRVSLDAREITRRSNMADAVLICLSHLELWVGEHAQDLIFIHAGCVVYRDRAVIVPGHTRYGKTTLTMALVATGARYFSDEYAIFDRDGLVHPYRRTPSVRAGGPEVAINGLTSDLTSEPVGPVSLGLVALIRYDADAGWDVTSTSVSHGVLSVMAHALAAQQRPLEVLDSLRRAARHAQFTTGTRGDAVDAAEALLNLMLET